MSKKLFVPIVSVITLLILINCGGKTAVVDSGTYTGEIKKVEAEKREIYVILEEGKTIELYFTDQTSLTKNGQAADFSELQKGQKVTLSVERVGNRLDPLTVDILE